jgi:uncharacterized protein (DUF302 family)
LAAVIVEIAMGLLKATVKRSVSEAVEVVFPKFHVYGMMLVTVGRVVSPPT